MHKAKHRRSRTSLFSLIEPRVRVRNSRRPAGNPDGNPLPSLGVEIEFHRATTFRVN